MKPDAKYKQFNIVTIMAEAHRHRTLSSLSRACGMRTDKVKIKLEKLGKLDEVAIILKRWSK